MGRGRTLTAVARHLGEGAVAAVALPADDPCLAGALAGDRVAGARVGPQGEAVTWVAGVVVLGSVVIVLWGEEE